MPIVKGERLVARDGVGYMERVAIGRKVGQRDICRRDGDADVLVAVAPLASVEVIVTR